MNVNVRWLAGFFDGEGSISVARQGVGHSNAAPRILPRDGVRFENITVPNTGVAGEHIRR